MVNACALSASILGEPTTDYEQQLTFISRLFWITYRHDFPYIAGTSFTSDSGWGCMIRSGQMLAAVAIATALQGKSWLCSGHDADFRMFIIGMFLDSHDHPLSLHNLVVHGQREMGRLAGEWHAPSITAQCLSSLVNTKLVLGMRSYCVTDMALDKHTVMPLLDGAKLVIWIPMRLGLDTVNACYIQPIKQLLGMRQSLGIAGGRPNSSLYFVGFEGDELLYLDPHYSRPCIARPDQLKDQLETYSFKQVKKVPFSSIDPCFVVAFVISDLDEFHEWTANMQLIKNDAGDSLISFYPDGDGGHDGATVERRHTVTSRTVDDDIISIDFENDE